jgi:hypothetical protein
MKGDFKPLRFKGAADLCRAKNIEKMLEIVPKSGLVRINDFYFIDGKYRGQKC